MDCGKAEQCGSELEWFFLALKNVMMWYQFVIGIGKGSECVGVVSQTHPYGTSTHSRFHSHDGIVNVLIVLNE